MIFLISKWYNNDGYDMSGWNPYRYVETEQEAIDFCGTDGGTYKNLWKEYKYDKVKKLEIKNEKSPS